MQVTGGCGKKGCGFLTGKNSHHSLLCGDHRNSFRCEYLYIEKISDATISVPLLSEVAFTPFQVQMHLLLGKALY